MQKIGMIYDGGEKSPNKKKLKHREHFVADESTSKGQIAFIEGWNEMRKCLIENGLMEPK